MKPGLLKQAKWLVAQGIDKDDVQRALKAIQGSEKVGKKSPSLLGLLVKVGALDRDRAKELQEAWKARLEGRQPEQAPAPSEAEEEVESAAEASHDEVEPSEEPSAEQESPAAQPDEEPQQEDPESDEEDDAPAQRTCPECQSLNDASDDSCRTCGAELPDLRIIDCVFCGQKVPRRAKACSNCGCHPRTGKPGKTSIRCNACDAVLKPEQVVCVECGAPRKKKAMGQWALAGSLAGVVQLLLVIGVMVMAGPIPSETVEEKTTVVDDRDPYEDLPARSLMNPAEDVAPEELQGLVKTGLQLYHDDLLPTMEEHLLNQEERMGAPGYVLLAACYFRQNRGPELISLAKALPQEKGISSLAAIWRYREARDRFEDPLQWAVANAIMEKAIDGDDLDGHALFWGGLMAWAQEDRATAQRCFKRSLSKDGPRHAHFFLALLNPANLQEHREKLMEGSNNTEPLEALVKAYLKGT